MFSAAAKVVAGSIEDAISLHGHSIREVHNCWVVLHDRQVHSLNDALNMYGENRKLDAFDCMSERKLEQHKCHFSSERRKEEIILHLPLCLLMI